MKARVQCFFLQPTPSFPDAPQREEYESDESFRQAGLRYEQEWRAIYECMDENCQSHDCPEHHPSK